MDDNKFWGEAHRSRQTAAADLTGTVPVRVSLYGEQVTIPTVGSKMTALADEGTYFVAVNPTRGTGIDGHAAPTAITVDTKPYVLLYNGNSSTANPSKRIYLDFIRLQATAAGTNGTNALWAAAIDTGGSRFSSGSTTVTPKSANYGTSDITTAATLYVGATTATAATSNQRLMGSGVLRSVIQVIGDTFVWDFGSTAKTQASMIVAGTAICNITIPMPPVVLGPGDNFLLHLAAASQSVAASYEVTIGYWER